MKQKRRVVKQWYVVMRVPGRPRMSMGPMTHQMALVAAKRNGGEVVRDRDRATGDGGGR